MVEIVQDHNRALPMRRSGSGAPIADVFLSYSSKDRQAAERVEQALTARGIGVFWDQETPPGVDWDTWIRDKLANARAAVVLWSKSSIASPNVRHEAIVARDAGKLVPVMIEALSPSDFPMGLYLVQGIQLEDWRDGKSSGMERLVTEVQARVIREAGAETGTGTAKAPWKPRNVAALTKPSGVSVVVAGLVIAAVLGVVGWSALKPDRSVGDAAAARTPTVAAATPQPSCADRSVPSPGGCASSNPPIAPAPTVATAPMVATVTADVDVYDQPDGIGNLYDGLFLHVGQQLVLVEPCRDNWCHLLIPEAPGGEGWVYQDGFLQIAVR